MSVDGFDGEIRSLQGGAVELLCTPPAGGVSELRRKPPLLPVALACAVWLEGSWGSSRPVGSEPPRPPGAWPFTVLRFHALLQAEPPAEPVHALIEQPAP